MAKHWIPSQRNFLDPSLALFDTRLQSLAQLSQVVLVAHDSRFDQGNALVVLIEPGVDLRQLGPQLVQPFVVTGALRLDQLEALCNASSALESRCSSWSILLSVVTVRE